MRKAVLCLLLATSCSDESGLNLFNVTISGSSAVSQYRVSMGRRQFPAFLPPRNGATSTSAELCTHNREVFLHGPIPFVVLDANGTSITGTFLPVACSLSSRGGARELDNFVLQDDGTLLTDVTAGNPRVWANCLPDLPPGDSCVTGADDF